MSVEANSSDLFLAWWKFLFQPGAVVEIRVPKAGKEKTISGYVDNPQALAKLALENDRKASGVYCTLNKIDPSLLARANNRTHSYAEHTTADSDVKLRRNLLVDIDAVRPSGISANDAEHLAALDLARLIRSELMHEGWPEPIVQDSGNGAYLVFALPDLPNDDCSRDLIRTCLGTLAKRFNTASAVVDQSTYNASRIAKIPGTTARKGDSTDARPHRLSCLLDVPDVREPIGLELLEHRAPAVQLPQAFVKPTIHHSSSSQRFDLEQWLSTAGVRVKRAGVGKSGGAKFELEECPFQPNDHGGNPFVEQLPGDGAYIFKCFHGDCEGNGWKEFRRHVEPGYEQRAAATVNVASDGPTDCKFLGLPRICSNGRQLRDKSADAIAALHAANDPPMLFARSGRIAVVVCDKDGRHAVVDLKEDSMRGMLTRTADWFVAFKAKAGERVETSCAPPLDVVKDLLSLPQSELPFPSLEGLVETPVLRPDGTILNEPGYDPATKLFFALDPGLRLSEIPRFPSAPQVRAAVSLIADELLGDFPFVDQASKANSFAGLLSPIIKAAINNEPTPAKLNVAPQAGTGKSLEAEVAAIITTGRAAEMFSLPRDEEETRKTICTALRSGARMVVFDNVTHKVTSGELCKVVTATQFADREFRTHDKILLPVCCCFVLTGNNLQVGGDMPRRVYWTHMDARQSKPFMRDGFRHPNLKAWVSNHRGALLAALLTIARAWFVAGKPAPKLTPLGGFEAWTTMTGGILEFAGVEGFLGNAAALYEETDSDSTEWEGFLLAVHACFEARAFTVAEIAEKLHDKYSAERDTLRAALPGFLAEVMDREGFFQRRAGKCFAERAGRRFGDTQIHLKRSVLLHGRQQWQTVRPAGQQEGM